MRSEALHKSWEPRSETRSRKRRKIVKDEVEEPTEFPAAPVVDVYMSVDEFEEDESKALEEMRILIKVNAARSCMFMRFLLTCLCSWISSLGL